MRHPRPLRLGWGPQPDSYPQSERPFSAGIDFRSPKDGSATLLWEDGILRCSRQFEARGYLLPEGYPFEFLTDAGSVSMYAEAGKGGPLFVVDVGGASVTGSAATGWQFVGDAEFTGAMVAASLFVQAGSSVGGTVTEPTTISPSAFGASQNNWSPSGITGSRNVRLSASSGGLSITGISASQGGGRLLRLFNIGANAVTLAHESGSSSAANRFRCPGGAGFSLAADAGVDLFYDGLSSRWRLVR